MSRSRGDRLSALLLRLAIFASAATAAEPRSAAVIAPFKRANPCPLTRLVKGACPGWQVDHVLPICAGSADSVANLQWLTVAEHKTKPRSDVSACRRRLSPPLYDSLTAVGLGAANGL
jgi:hypothetical protein